MSSYFISLSYNGKNYNGWQSQKNSTGIQQVIEEKMSLKLRQPIKLTGAGRTDTGVHASFYVASFDIENPLENTTWAVKELNAFLPKDIAIHQIVRVKDGANARYDAVKRTYHYFVSTSKNPFLQDFTHRIFYPVDLERINRSLSYLKGTHEFDSFEKKHGSAKTTVCKVYEAECNPAPFGFYIKITANRFLRNMVRSIVGTVLKIEKENLAPEHILEVMEAKDRSSAGESVPACGLFLTNIEYPEDIFINEPIKPLKNFLLK